MNASADNWKESIFYQELETRALQLMAIKLVRDIYYMLREKQGYLLKHGLLVQEPNTCLLKIYCTLLSEVIF